MAQQVINLGAAGSGAGGDSARTAFEKAIANFAELYIAALPGTAAQKAAARAQFGLGTASLQPVQTSQTDTTPGAVLVTGAFGLGRELHPSSVYITDADALLATGDYAVGATWVGSPTPGTAGSNQGSLRHTANFQTTGYAKQEWTSLNQTVQRSMIRSKINGVWGPWRDLFHSANILGTVSQVGGVPTGAIIERGSNANGEYIKWADGTLECWLRSVTVDCVADTDLDVTWPLPAAFNAVNAAVTCTLRSPATTNVFTVHKLQGNHTSAAACTMRVRFSVTQSYLLTFHAIGRWY